MLMYQKKKDEQWASRCLIGARSTINKYILIYKYVYIIKGLNLLGFIIVFNDVKQFS